ncbi:MAG TPA: transglutaminase family protein [Novosphingobium sp.]|nr:transglutaminase family protein [Novosphingobium sp.]
MRYAVSHLTTLKYASPLAQARFNIRLKPAPWPGQTVSGHVLTVDPLPWVRTDTPGAYLVNETRITIEQPIVQLRIESRFTAEVAPPGDRAAGPAGPSVGELRSMALARRDLTATSPASYFFASPIAKPVPDIARWAAGIVRDTMPVIDAGRALMSAIHGQFAFDGAATLPDTPPDEAFAKRRGVCQDFAHVMVVAARACGIPAAYVSGYLRTLPPPGQQRLVGADAMHAWVNLWCGEELGWIGFDPTNDMRAGTDHIFIAMGRDYGDVAPIDGVFRGSTRQAMFFSVDVAPLDSA